MLIILSLYPVWCFLSEIMVNMGYSRQNIEDSVIHQKFDDIQATYLLLGRRTTDVSIRANTGVLFYLFNLSGPLWTQNLYRFELLQHLGSRGHEFETPQALCCVHEQDTLMSVEYWFNPGRLFEKHPRMTENCWLGRKESTQTKYRNYWQLTIWEPRIWPCNTKVKVFMIIPDFRILRMTFHRKSQNAELRRLY